MEGGREQGRGGGEILLLMEVGLVAAQGLLAGDGRPFEVRQDQKSRITKQRDFTPARLSARLSRHSSLQGRDSAACRRGVLP